jgi:hypothetical protein
MIHQSLRRITPTIQVTPFFSTVRVDYSTDPLFNPGQLGLPPRFRVPRNFGPTLSITRNTYTQLCLTASRNAEKCCSLQDFGRRLANNEGKFERLVFARKEELTKRRQACNS